MLVTILFIISALITNTTACRNYFDYISKDGTNKLIKLPYECRPNITDQIYPEIAYKRCYFFQDDDTDSTDDSVPIKPVRIDEREVYSAITYACLTRYNLTSIPSPIVESMYNIDYLKINTKFRKYISTINFNMTSDTHGFSALQKVMSDFQNNTNNSISPPQSDDYFSIFRSFKLNNHMFDIQPISDDVTVLKSDSIVKRDVSHVKSKPVDNNVCTLSCTNTNLSLTCPTTNLFLDPCDLSCPITDLSQSNQEVFENTRDSNSCPVSWPKTKLFQTRHGVYKESCVLSCSDTSLFRTNQGVYIVGGNGSCSLSCPTTDSVVRQSSCNLPCLGKKSKSDQNVFSSKDNMKQSCILSCPLTDKSKRDVDAVSNQQSESKSESESVGQETGPVGQETGPVGQEPTVNKYDVSTQNFKYKPIHIQFVTNKQCLVYCDFMDILQNKSDSLLTPLCTQCFKYFKYFTSFDSYHRISSFLTINDNPLYDISWYNVKQPLELTTYTISINITGPDSFDFGILNNNRTVIPIDSTTMSTPMGNISHTPNLTTTTTPPFTTSHANLTYAAIISKYTHKLLIRSIVMGISIGIIVIMGVIMIWLNFQTPKSKDSVPLVPDNIVHDKEKGKYSVTPQTDEGV